MANSKSQIYPIQLQGAELNLNKYDAEIKQYSGFNKNNSPFVGGCLSNVFTHEEQIEGGNADNVYIAENGDVYHVTTEGLFKNDEKVIDTTDTDFYDVVDLGADVFPGSVIYIHDEETYLYTKDNKFYYHSGKIDHDFLSPYNETVNINGFPQVSFQIKKVIISGVEYEVVGIIFNKKANSTPPQVYIYLNIYKKDNEGLLENVSILKIDGTNFQGNFRASDRPDLGFVFKVFGDTFSNFRLVILTAPTTSSVNIKNNFEIGFDGSIITLLNNLLVTDSNDNSSKLTALMNGRFTDDYFVLCNIPGGTNNIYSSVRSTYTIDLENHKIILNDMDTSSGGDLIGSNGKYDIIKSWGILTALKIHEGNCFTIDDDITSFAYVSDEIVSNYKVQFNLGGILNGCVLINNRLASGLSLPGGAVLVTEWNSVDLDYIFFGDNTEEWKNNKFVYIWKNINSDKWFKLVKSTPKLKVIDNQIVINSNTIYNSYAYKRNMKLLFAPAWNNRRPNLFYNNTSEVAVYMATAINEYNLEKNASLILNPVLVSGGPSTSGVDRYTRDIYNLLCIDIYSGTTEIKYKYSQNLINNEVLTNNALIDLPFPSNTDGNVQYSPSLFAVEKSRYGNLVFISEYGTAYKLMTYDNKAVMSYFLSTAIEDLEDFFSIQGQLYGILDSQVYSFEIVNEIAVKGNFVVSVENLQFCGNTPYEALFYSKTNRCLYSFTGANVLNQKQLVDKISEVRNYLYNPATQTVFLITDIGVLFYGLFGMFLLEYTDITNIFLLDNGIVMSDNIGNYHYIKYYLDEGETNYTKENIRLETCFYGMNNEVVTINDCLYIRLFSEEHEEGLLKVKATTISLKGRQTEETTFKIKASDWDKLTHTIYLRYQPKTQRGLGISFSVDSPFKIASMSVGSQPDAVLVDKVSKGAITAPSVTTNNDEW